MKMLMLLFIVVLFTVGDVTSVTDEEFQKLEGLLDQQGAQVAQLAALVNQQIIRIDQQDQVIFDQAVEITQLKQALAFLPTNSDKNILPTGNNHSEDLSETFQNITLEERVSLLELQMTETQGDINGIEQNIGFPEDEQFLQDQRIFNLEKDVDLVSQDILDLQATTLTLDHRLTSLEENGGGNANITQLKTRVTELEILSADQGISIGINEENIQGLQSSDVAIEARATALEENNGGGESSNESSTAFFAVLPDSPIPEGTNVKFEDVLINDGDGYNPSTGTFTVPPGGDGLYYFSTYLLVSFNEYGRFYIQINEGILCTAYGFDVVNGNELQQATCSGLAQLTEGDEVSLVFDFGIDTSPLIIVGYYNYNGFSGFRL